MLVLLGAVLGALFLVLVGSRELGRLRRGLAVAQTAREEAEADAARSRVYLDELEREAIAVRDLSGFYRVHTVQTLVPGRPM